MFAAQSFTNLLRKKTENLSYRNSVRPLLPVVGRLVGIVIVVVVGVDVAKVVVIVTVDAVVRISFKVVEKDVSEVERVTLAVVDVDAVTEVVEVEDCSAF